MVTMSDMGEKAFLKALLPELHVAPIFVNGFGHDARCGLRYACRAGASNAGQH